MLFITCSIVPPQLNSGQKLKWPENVKEDVIKHCSRTETQGKVCDLLQSNGCCRAEVGVINEKDSELSFKILVAFNNLENLNKFIAFAGHSNFTAISSALRALLRVSKDTDYQCSIDQTKLRNDLEKGVNFFKYCKYCDVMIE